MRIDLDEPPVRVSKTRLHGGHPITDRDDLKAVVGFRLGRTSLVTTNFHGELGPGQHDFRHLDAAVLLAVPRDLDHVTIVRSIDELKFQPCRRAEMPLLAEAGVNAEGRKLVAPLAARLKEDVRNGTCTVSVGRLGTAVLRWTGCTTWTGGLPFNAFGYPVGSMSDDSGGPIITRGGHSGTPVYWRHHGGLVGIGHLQGEMDVLIDGKDVRCDIVVASEELVPK